MAGRAAAFDINLPQLQNLIKRDPESYKDDFTRQYAHFESILEIYKLQPTAESKIFCELLMFIANTAYCYSSLTAGFPDILMNLLRSQTGLNSEVRKTIVQALMQLRSKNIVDQITVLSLFFSLLRTRDKSLRAHLNLYIQSDIKKSNIKAKNNKLNKAIQNHILAMVSGDIESGEGSDTAIMIAVQICQEMYKKQIWTDAKTVSILGESLFSPFNKVMVSALKFFLGRNNTEDESEDENEVDFDKVQFRARITKKSRSSHAKVEKALKMLKKKDNKTKKAEEFNFSALHLLNDPQGLAERLFKRMTSKGDRIVGDGKVEKEVKFEIKLMMMNLISRIIGIHKLILLNFYPYAIKFLKSHQQDVTQVMAACAQASHDLVPPDAIEPIIRALIDNFISDAYSGEVIAAGINSVREIARRCPLSMDPELLSYIVTFKTHRDKGVNIAAKSVIGLFREMAPEMLPKKERGKAGAMDVARGNIKDRSFGKQSENIFFDADLLEQLDAEAEDGAWDMDEEEDEEKEEGWKSVSSDGEEEIPDDLKFKDKSDKKYKVFYGLKFHKGEIEAEIEDHDEEQVVEDDYGEDVDGLNELEETEDGSEIEKLEDEEDVNMNEVDNIEIQGHAASLEPKKRVETMRILTPADFERLKKLKMEKQAQELLNPRGKKRSAAEMEPEDDEEHVHNVISTTTIEGYHRKKKNSKEERIASIMEGRKDREKYGSKKGSKERGSLTNREHAKNKNFMMIVHKRDVVAKKKMSMRDKQMRLRKHVEKEKKQL